MSARAPARLTLGPLLFHWPAAKRRDFYFRIADEATLDSVYLGEVVCSKRVPAFEPYRAAVIERLTAAGKELTARVPGWAAQSENAALPENAAQ